MYAPAEGVAQNTHRDKSKRNYGKQEMQLPFVIRTSLVFLQLIPSGLFIFDQSQIIPY